MAGGLNHSNHTRIVTLDRNKQLEETDTIYVLKHHFFVGRPLWAQVRSGETGMRGTGDPTAATVAQCFFLMLITLLSFTKCLFLLVAWVKWQEVDHVCSLISLVDSWFSLINSWFNPFQSFFPNPGGVASLLPHEDTEKWRRFAQQGQRQAADDPVLDRSQIPRWIFGNGTRILGSRWTQQSSEVEHAQIAIRIVGNGRSWCWITSYSRLNWGRFIKSWM